MFICIKQRRLINFFLKIVNSATLGKKFFFTLISIYIYLQIYIIKTTPNMNFGGKNRAMSSLPYLLMNCPKLLVHPPIINLSGVYEYKHF